ncbi:afadin- and alpha-actinin-binding protein-like isoform X1 [Penaeus chinensis]|uniref:afadin- and alpha-actinin-binding protein-like isoform X1 n=1 Tax=Penaeus chinensis TaxID=139456 RepID=UPI001FB64A90|nr:afadin- and alpha-actinin-binding protein-like isoform X1 [Penaeus chinensis]XP_047483118.1 afadin- and alpha-actinin-binding protein-like isoform X1 [Penaeus chinensis]
MGEKMKKGQLCYLVSLCDAGAAGEGKHQVVSPVDSPPYFCTTNNMQSAVVYLSQELQGLGLNCGLIETGSQKVNLVALINACWEVSRLYRSSVHDCNTLQDQRRRDAADMNHFQNSIRDLRGTVDDKERQVCDAQERERQAVTVNKALASKLKAEKEEVRRLGSVLQQREAHHQHELRKKETENSRLRERLHKLVSGEKSSETRAPAMTISNTLSRSNRSRAKWKTEASGVRHEEDMHRKVLSQYEAWVGQLSDENEQLKSCLSSMSSQILRLASKFTKRETRLTSEDVNSSMNSSTFSTDSLDDPVFNLDFPAFRSQIQRSLDENLKTITQGVEEKVVKDNIAQNVDLQAREEVKTLRLQLSKVKEQLRNHQQCQKKGNDDEKEMTFLMDGSYIEERAELEKERQELEKERRTWQQERESFAEAAIRLNRERAAFEGEKVELLKRQFLQDLPTTLNDLGTADVMTSGHESGGSLSSGSIGEVFSDSPHRILAVPEITPPRGNITLARGSQPVVLGPTMMPKQRNERPGYGGHKVVYRMKSAPASRASSVPRFTDEFEGKSPSPSNRPPHPRPRTLERMKRKPLSGSASPRYRSQSQGRLELAKDDDHVKKRGEFTSLPARIQGEALLRSLRTDGREVIYPPITVDREGLNYLPAYYRENPKIVKIPEQRYPQDNHIQAERDRYEAEEDEEPVDSKGLTLLEKDLMNLMVQIGQQQGEEIALNSFSDNSPMYEEPTFMRKHSKKNPSSVRLSAPGSLCSSRRSSRDLSDDYYKNIHKHLMKKNQS